MHVCFGVCVSHSHQWRLDALLWILQLLILRAAARCRYTAFFMMAGSLASISDAVMHSSKNPAHRVSAKQVKGHIKDVDLLKKKNKSYKFLHEGAN